MKLYHITKGKYLSIILSEGLRVNSRKTGFCKREAHRRYKSYYGMQPIFLTNDVEFTCKTMLSDGWIVKWNPILLEVHVQLDGRNSSQGWFRDTPNGGVATEFRYYQNIDPQNIRVVRPIFPEEGGSANID